jgi:predicted RNA-binding protein with PIN domain
MEHKDMYDKLFNLLTEEFESEGKKYNLKEDFEKFFTKGNQTAGTRIRKVMQELKSMAQEIRNSVQDYKNQIK